ncbi:multidrug efflux SMR transporter [Paenibacillus sp. SI8]|uniref:DMT family transporter n=1 Tax=unclassified Paenibacillus TaxID=185978 RepID=UPI00346579A7
MNSFLILAASIAAEVFGSSMMKLSNGFRKVYPSIGMIVGMGLAMFGLSLALKTIPLGTAYAIWSGAGTALTALVGIVIFKDKINFQKVSGIVLIIVGVIVMKLAS